jgi:DNA-binding CsgD family transcriptional regulator
MEAQRDYQENGWYLRDTRSIRAVEQSLWLRRDATTDGDVISEDEMASDPFYTEFLARHGLRWCVAMGIAPHPHIAAGLSIQRGRDRPAFSDAERDLATRLGLHVEKSLRLSIRLLDTELVNLGLGEALARIGIAMFALDSLGRIVESNAAADALPPGQIFNRNGRLSIGPTAARVSLERAIAQALSGEFPDLVADPKPIVLHHASSEQPLVIYVLPIGTPTRPVEHFLTQTRAIVLVIDPKAGEPADPAVVRDVFGLTLGEARVAALVGSGLAPREAALRLGIGEETARTVLKRVFSKVGVSRQSELTALLTRLVLR